MFHCLVDEKQDGSFGIKDRDMHAYYLLTNEYKLLLLSTQKTGFSYLLITFDPARPESFVTAVPASCKQV